MPSVYPFRSDNVVSIPPYAAPRFVPNPRPIEGPVTRDAWLWDFATGGPGFDTGTDHKVAPRGPASPGARETQTEGPVAPAAIVQAQTTIDGSTATPPAVSTPRHEAAPLFYAPQTIPGQLGMEETS